MYFNIHICGAVASPLCEGAVGGRGVGEHHIRVADRGRGPGRPDIFWREQSWRKKLATEGQRERDRPFLTTPPGGGGQAPGLKKRLKDGGKKLPADLPLNL